MEFLGKSKGELVDQLIHFASSLNENDLKDPAVHGQVSQLLNILDPQADKLPIELVQKLQSMPDPKQRFMEAAMATSAKSPDQIGKLIESLKSEGLMKAEDLEKISPKEIQNSHILMFPVSIRGKEAEGHHSPNYHVTLKWFGNNKKEEDHKKIQNIVDRHNLSGAHDFEIEPAVLNTPRGDVHVLKIHGPNKPLEYAHHELSEETPSMHKYMPHITVSKELHDEVKAKNLTAKDLNIKIHPLEYRVGNETKKRYMPQNPPEASQAIAPMKMAKAEDMDKSKLAKYVDSLKGKKLFTLAERLENLTKNSIEKMMTSKAKMAAGLFDREHLGTDEDACVEDFRTDNNEGFEKQVKAKLHGLEKGAKESYGGANADLKISHKLLSEPGEKPQEKPGKLLPDEKSNAKTAKNAEVAGHKSAMLSLAPAGLAGRGNVCPGLSAGCKASCLNTAGIGAMVKEHQTDQARKRGMTVQNSRVKKTQHLFDHPHDFMNHLDREITNFKGRAAKEGKKPTVRLNGTSDLAWEHFRPKQWEGKNVFEKHPDVQFHDYTARPERVRENKHPNYHLTFSLKEDNHHIAKKLLSEGHNVAVPFGYKTGAPAKGAKTPEEKVSNRPLPKEHWGHNVVDGDIHDLRHLDPKGNAQTGGHIVGLRAKGEALHDTSGFVQWGHAGQPDSKPKARKEGAKTKEQIVQSALRQPKKEEKLAANEESKLKPSSFYKDLRKKIGK